MMPFIVRLPLFGFDIFAALNIINVRPYRRFREPFVRL